MLQIHAAIKLFKEGRKTPFYNGYQPLFNFIPEMKKSGKIMLLDRYEFYPGDEGNVNILFIDDNYLGIDFGKGKYFVFGEGIFTMGEGNVISFLNV